MPIKNYIARPDATFVGNDNTFRQKEEGGNFLSTVADYLTPDMTPIRNMAHDIGTLIGANSDRYQMTGNDAMQLALAAIPIAGKKMKLSHYSAAEREVLSPKFLGTGYASQELKAGIPKTKWVNYYNEALGAPEKTVMKNFPVRHEVAGKFNILDLASEEGSSLLQRAQKKAANVPGGDIMEYAHRLAKTEGYDGIHNSEFMPQVVRLFGEQKPTKIITKK